MKKIFLLLSIIGTFTLTSCNVDDDRADNDTISEVFQLTDVDFLPNDYSIVYPLDPPIYTSDVVLVYRQVGLSGNRPIWEPVPHTLYLNDGAELDYKFDFTSEDINIYMQANFDLAEVPQYTQNQTFRIAIVPGYFSQTVDVNDYDAVMSAISAQNGGGDVRIETIQK